MSALNRTSHLSVFMFLSSTFGKNEIQNCRNFRFSFQFNVDEKLSVLSDPEKSAIKKSSKEQVAWNHFDWSILDA